MKTKARPMAFHRVCIKTQSGARIFPPPHLPALARAEGTFLFLSVPSFFFYSPSEKMKPGEEICPSGLHSHSRSLQTFGLPSLHPGRSPAALTLDVGELELDLP